MSDAKSCDGCGKVLVLAYQESDVDGEVSAWIRLLVGPMTFDTCTRACAVAVLERDDVRQMHDEYVADVMEVARSVHPPELPDLPEEPDADDDRTP